MSQVQAPAKQAKPVPANAAAAKAYEAMQNADSGAEFVEAKQAFNAAQKAVKAPVYN